jgi:hypothetical protein
MYLVPIYDASLKQFQMRNSELKRLHTTLPSFDEGEIPIGSLAMVGYTLSSFKKSESAHLSANLNWVVVIRSSG